MFFVGENKQRPQSFSRKRKFVAFVIHNTRPAARENGSEGDGSIVRFEGEAGY